MKKKILMLIIALFIFIPIAKADTLDDIIEFIEDEDDERERYYFKTYVWINNTAKKVCCMMWLDVTGEASGIIFNETDVDAYRYGKQKVKDKYVIL